MITSLKSEPPTNTREMIAWLLRLGRPPLPECPIEAAKQGREPKAPCYFDGKRVVPISWKQWQKEQPIPEIFDAWFMNQKTGIGTLGGWNGRHWLGWIDVDQKDFASSEECDRAIATWLEQYPIMTQAPMFRTPSGGYRFLVAFNREPENFKANSGFSLSPDGSHHVGELLSKNGGHTLLPPTIGTNGKPYFWERWNDYPPVVEQPEDIGLYPVQKRTESKPAVAPRRGTEDNSLTQMLEREINPKLTSEQAFNWSGHDFKAFGDRLKGNCPWHESQSGTAFYVDRKDGSWLWRCPACDIGGGVIEYRHRLHGGNGSPRGKDFIDIVQELANEVGVAFPSSPNSSEQSVSLKSDRPLKVVEHPSAKRQQELVTEEELYQRIDDLISQDLQPSKLTSKLNLLAKETGFQPAEVKRIYQERTQEQELAESREERVAEIDDLLKVGSSSLKLAEELPSLYAQPLIKLAQHLSLREEVYLLALLTGLSICHRSETRLVIHRGQGFSVPLNLFAGIVSESGQRKSPVIKEIITTPLRLLQREAKAEHQAIIAKYQADLEHWNSLDKDGREVEFPDGIPQQPVRQRIYFFTSTSGSESINRQVDAHPDQPLLYLKDELMGVFTQQGKYSQGRGSEKQDFLSYYDGTGSTELLTDGVRSDTETILMSIFGSVQPEVLRKFTKDCSDPDGQWARFLWVNQPLAAATLQDDTSGDVDITDLLAGLYRRVCALPAIEYTLSRDAFKLYQKAYNRIEQLRINCPDPGLRAIYSKITGQLGRLIVNCHVIHELASGREFCTEVPVHRVKQGIRLIHFFIEQAKIIRSEGNAAKGDLPDILAKIIRLSQRLGRVKAKQVQQNYESIKLTPDQIRNAFIELEGMGYGPTYGRGNRMEWEYAPRQGNHAVDVGQMVGESVGAVGETVGEAPTAESTQLQDLQETVGEIGVVGGFPKNFIQREVDRTSGSEEPNLSVLSPTAPTAPTESGNHYGNRVSAVGETPTNSPTAPTVLPTGASSNKTSYENGCSAVGGLPTAPTVRTAHNCQQPPVTTKQAPGFRVGDRCRYIGPEGAMTVSCRGRSLEVLETHSNNGVLEVRIKADGWATDYWVPFQDLRRDRQ